MIGRGSNSWPTPVNPIVRHFHLTWICRTINRPTFSPYVKMSDDWSSWIVRHSIMLKVTWRCFDQSAKQLVLGRTTKLPLTRNCGGSVDCARRIWEEIAAVQWTVDNLTFHSYKWHDLGFMAWYQILSSLVPFTVLYISWLSGWTNGSDIMGCGSVLV